ncbi:MULTISPECIES: hypothetical protein [Roseobacteraceae]|uniref:Uncharacterized protein n=1 Tax=Pseudosulfitobacter pseudonitzschiae TaxID=1402135 RepID=A0A221K269_9RHOB|nr:MULTISPECIES: hypothetical protein [Roseobacteraceae]ASM72927.1 hypothetical protein SULPSESMR1_02126 [Pseudosulfitobacter pseudonitzschiae]
MQSFKFRPWGRPSWLRAKYDEEKWSFIACHGFEKRSAKSVVASTTSSDEVFFIRIDDPLLGQTEEQAERERAYSTNLEIMTANCSANIHQVREPLKASIDTIRTICERAGAASGNVVLDITSLPKRWFFPMVRFLVQNPDVLNLQVIYTKGDVHAEALSVNPETLRVLPTFMSEDDRDDHDFAFVGVGFHTHSMMQLFGDDKAMSLQLLFPFPPGPPGIHRNWKFVQEVEMKVQRDDSLLEGSDPISYLHLDSMDVSQTFDAIKIVTEGGDRTSVMAPYGPKPFSLAMCLFAIASERSGKAEVPVYYSQPQKYAVNYTNDVALRHDTLDSWAYAVKKDGKFIYEL